MGYYEALYLISYFRVCAYVCNSSNKSSCYSGAQIEKRLQNSWAVVSLLVGAFKELLPCLLFAGCKSVLSGSDRFEWFGCCRPQQREPYSYSSVYMPLAIRNSFLVFGVEIFQVAWRLDNYKFIIQVFL